jgi:hypothetical protein
MCQYIIVWVFGFRYGLFSCNVQQYLGTSLQLLQFDYRLQNSDPYSNVGTVITS